MGDMRLGIADLDTHTIEFTGAGGGKIKSRMRRGTDSNLPNSPPSEHCPLRYLGFGPPSPPGRLVPYGFVEDGLQCLF